MRRAGSRRAPNRQKARRAILEDRVETAGPDPNLLGRVPHAG